MDLPARKKHDAVPPHLLNADPLAQIIGTETVADVIINDVEACALLDSGATADLMTQPYAKARNFDIRLMTELSDHFVNLRLAARFKTTSSGYVKYNLQIPRISSYNSDQVALVAKDHTPFIREVPLTIGTKTEDTILEALKEGEIEMLDSAWKRVKNNWSLYKLQEEVGIREAVVWVAHATGQKPPEFKDHTPYSNQGMEDLLELNEIASAILLKSNKTIRARTPLVLMGTKMNVMTELLHRTNKALSWGLHVPPSYGMCNCSSQKMTIQLYNTKDHTIIIKKGMAVAQMVATNEVPEIVVADGMVGALQTQRWAMEGRVMSVVQKVGAFQSRVMDRREQGESSQLAG